MSFSNRLLLCGILGAGITASAGISANVSSLDIPLCKEAPVLDGTAGESQWDGALAVKQLYRIKSVEPAPETSVRLMRDNTWLYLAAECRNPGMTHLEPKAKADNQMVNYDDSLEIFISPTGERGDEYYHFLLNYIGVATVQRCLNEDVGAPRISNVLRDIGWNPPWRRATQRKDDGWSAEIAIPLFMVAGEKPETMRINICRNFEDVEFDENGATARKPMVWSTLRPDNQGGFHDFHNFVAVGDLNGFEPDVSVFAPRIASIYFSGLRSTRGRTFYDVRLTLETTTPVNGPVELAVLEDFGNGEKRTLHQQVDLSGREKVELSVPAGDLEPRRIRFVLNDPKTGQRLAERLTGMQDFRSLIVKDGQPFFNRSARIPDRSFAYLVAASDAPESLRAQADFLCDGTDDHVEINAAIAELPETGGEVHLSAGNFHIGAVDGTYGGISIFRSNVLLTGEGSGTRLILQDGLTDINVIWIYEYEEFISDVTIRDLFIDGNIEKQTPWTSARAGWNGHNGVKSSGMWGPLGKTPVNVRVEKCHIENCPVMAVMLTGENVEVLDCYFTGSFGSHVIELLGDSGRIEGCMLRVRNGDKISYGFATDHSHFYHIVNNKIMVDPGGIIGSHPLNNWSVHRYGGPDVVNRYYGVISGNMIINKGLVGRPVRIQGYMDMISNNIFRNVPIEIIGMGVTFEHNIIIDGSLEINSPDRGDECRILVDGNSFFNSSVKHIKGDVEWGMNPGVNKPEPVE